MGLQAAQAGDQAISNAAKLKDHNCKRLHDWKGEVGGMGEHCSMEVVVRGDQGSGERRSRFSRIALQGVVVLLVHYGFM